MSTRSYLILHGIGNHRPPEHWQHWLAQRLTGHGDQVLYPGLPEPDQPRYGEWERMLEDLLAEMEGAERVVICHSLACLLWFRAARGLGRTGPVDRLLLVSPPASDLVPEAGASFRLDAGLDVGSIRASARDIRIACSDADPYNPAGAAELYAAPLDVAVDVIWDAEPITPSSAYGPWPSSEAWCLEE